MTTRRGSALILVLMMTLAVAGLSIAAIFMSSSAGLLSAFYDREREYRLAAEAGLEVVRSRLTQDSTLAIPDTGMRQLLAGFQTTDADGAVLNGVSVNVYAAMTGDTTGTQLPFITLIAAAYDARGTRHVRRMDLRRESFSRYSLFVDSFPSALVHGPGTVPGRVHTNGTWRSVGGGESYRDTVTAVVGITGSATFDVDSIVGVPRVPWPGDSTYPRLDTLAAAANLSFAPVSGGTRGSHLEFVAFDADADGSVESGEGFFRVFDLATGGSGDTLWLRATPPTYSFLWLWNRWDHPIVQNQCGAFYLRSGRWHFFPVASHRGPYAVAVIQSTASGDFPQVNNGKMNQMKDNDWVAVREVITANPTARCFPAGSPYLMPSERMTNSSGVVTGTAADSVPFGVVVPPGGWPGSAPNGYGGSDTTFTFRSRTCTIAITTGRCTAGSLMDLGSWRAFGGAAVTGVSASIRQANELPYLWPLSPPYNTASRGVVSATGGPLFLSGTVRGEVTLRAAGGVTLIDDLRYESDPADPLNSACRDQFGLLAVGDVLVVAGLTTRVRRIAGAGGPFGPWADMNSAGATEFTLHGSILSLTGTFGVEGASTTMGASAAQLRCPQNGAASTAANGGCLAHVGGAAMKRYSALYNGSNTGLRYAGVLDRCQNSTRRPPFFPLTNRFTFVRTLELEPSQANTPAKIRTLLLRLKGKTL